MPQSHTAGHGCSLQTAFRAIVADFWHLLAPAPNLCALCHSPLPPPILPFTTWQNEVLAVFCSKCLDHLAWVQPPLCAICGRPWRHTGLCRFCAKGLGVLSGRSALVYTGAVRTLVHELKFRAAYELGVPLGVIVAAVARFADGWRPQVIVPVPLHRDRLEERGFNQSELLAKGASGLLRCQVASDALARDKPTVPQSSLHETERWRNVQSAFTVPNPGKVRNRRVLLVDDVFTTGATLNAAGGALLQAGAADVRFATLAVAVNPTDLAGISLKCNRSIAQSGEIDRRSMAGKSVQGR